MTLGPDFIHRDLILKGRKVRTPAGVKFFKKPIGTPITAGMVEAAKAKHGDAKVEGVLMSQRRGEVKAERLYNATGRNKHGEMQNTIPSDGSPYVLHPKPADLARRRVAQGKREHEVQTYDPKDPFKGVKWNPQADSAHIDAHAGRDTAAKKVNYWRGMFDQYSNHDKWGVDGASDMDYFIEQVEKDPDLSDRQKSALLAKPKKDMAAWERKNG